MHYLLYIAYITPVFLAMAAFFALLFKRHKSKSHTALMFICLATAAINLVFAWHFFFSISNANHVVLHYPNLLVSVVCAPLLLTYFMSLLRPSIINRQRLLAYFAPSIFYIVTTIVLLLTDLYPQTYFNHKLLVRDIFTVGNIIRLTLLTTYLSHLVCYIYIVVKTLNSYRSSLKNKFSYTQGIKLSWAYWALLAAGVFALLPLSMTLFDTVYSWMLLLHGVLASIVICIWFFAGYYQPVLYADDELESYREQDFGRDEGTLDSLERLKRNILDLFERQKRFREMHLSVDDIAHELKSNRTYVSRVINEEFGTNFYGFVNKYRLAEFLRLLQQSENPANFKIKEVSEKVGFKSYTSFYSYFKEQTGYTPSEYVRRM
jgi:AraC-like DNA-binding protein